VKRFLRLFGPALLGASLLAGCGLQPMYAGGGSGAVARGLTGVQVAAIEGREGFALLSDDTIGRERRTLRARYQLVDLSSNEIVLDATAGSDAGIDVVSSDYATIAGEQTALENMSKDVASRIVTAVALRLRGDTKQ